LAIVEVRNLASVQMLRPGVRRHIVDLPLHVCAFTLDGLRRLLALNGFHRGGDDPLRAAAGADSNRR
jgi:hypothetical protein